MHVESEFSSNDVKFIKLVQQSPPLYGKTGAGVTYKQHEKKSQIWRSIAQQMKYTGNFCTFLIDLHLCSN